MNKDISNWVKTCQPCQRAKIHKHTRSPSGHFATSDHRFEHIHLNIVGPLPPSQGYKYCLTLKDRVSRWPETIPIVDMSAETVAKEFYSQRISCFGAPATITTDQGRQFESSLLRELTNLMDITKRRTAAYKPQKNGIIERWHRQFKASIKCRETEKWVDILPTVLLGLRTCYKEDLGCSVAELLYDTTRYPW